MKHVAMVMASLAISAVLVGPVQAQTAAGPTCNDVRWKAEILHKYPGIEKACVGVVVRDNINYVRVSGKVKSKANGVLRVRLDNTASEITWKPAKEDTVSIEGKPVPAMDVVVGQSLRFYMPEDRVAVVDISDKGVNPREVLP
jgi:hypothetical protein